MLKQRVLYWQSPTATLSVVKPEPIYPCSVSAAEWQQINFLSKGPFSLVYICRFFFFSFAFSSLNHPIVLVNFDIFTSLSLAITLYLIHILFCLVTWIIESMCYAFPYVLSMFFNLCLINSLCFQIIFLSKQRSFWSALTLIFFHYIVVIFPFWTLNLSFTCYLSYQIFQS